MNTLNRERGSRKFGVAAMGLVALAAQACMVGAGEDGIDSVDQGYGSCDGLAAWDGGNWQFTPRAGDILQHNGKAWQANQNIDYPNPECAPGAAASWCTNWFTDLGACGASAPSSPSTTKSTSSSLPAECFNNQMIDMMDAELAVAMARELGELNPTRDLRVNNGFVELSPTGLSRCSNNCERVKAVLSMQDSSVNDFIDQNTFNANSFRNTLVTQWNDQKIYEDGHAGQLPGPHTLTLTSESPAYCGIDYQFTVNWECGSSGTQTIALEAENANANRGSGNDTFYQSNGAMVCGNDDGNVWLSGWAASAPKLSYNVNFPVSGTYYVWVLSSAAHGGSDSLHAGIDGQENTTADAMWANIGSFGWGNGTMDGTRATLNVSAGNHSFDLYAREDGVKVDKIVLTTDPNLTPTGNGPSSSSGSCSTDTAKIENRMRFFRPENSVIDFRAGNGKITIDPQGTLSGSTGSSSGSCAEDTCSVFYKNASVGDCCTCKGRQGTFQKGSGMFTLLCK